MLRPGSLIQTAMDPDAFLGIALGQRLLPVSGDAPEKGKLHLPQWPALAVGMRPHSEVKIEKLTRTEVDASGNYFEEIGLHLRCGTVAVFNQKLPASSYRYEIQSSNWVVRVHNGVYAVRDACVSVAKGVAWVTPLTGGETKEVTAQHVYHCPSGWSNSYDNYGRSGLVYP